MRFTQSTLGAFGLLLLIGCGGTTTSQLTYTPSMQPNVPSKAEGCYDAALVLKADLAATKDIALKVLKAIDAQVEKETSDSIAAQRNRHIGLFVGSGGEEIFITLKATENGTTFVTVATKTGFVGGAGQKAWSCQIVDKMVELAAK